jgi:hypothetical protein
MAALFLLLLAIAGGVVVAASVLENTTAAQITLFHHTVTGGSEGWLLAIAAGLGALVALLLVASLNATKGRRVRREQLRRLRRGLEHQAVAPKPAYDRLLDEFFGPEETPRHLAGLVGLVGPRDEGREGPAEDRQRPVTPQRIDRHLQPRYQQARSAHLGSVGWDGPVDDHQSAVVPIPEPVEHHPAPLYEQARRAAGMHNDWDLPLPASQGRRR